MKKRIGCFLSILQILSLTAEPVKAVSPSAGSDSLVSQALETPLSAAFPVEGHAALMRSAAVAAGHLTLRQPEVTREEIGKRIVPGGEDWSLIFLDLDDMRHFNVDLEKPVVDVHYRDRIIRILDTDPRFEGLVKGFTGGDEVFIFIPGSPVEARALMEDLRQVFRNGGVNPDRRMTPSMGMLSRDQVPPDSDLYTLVDPKARYLRARELVSRGLESAKDELGKDAIAHYQPPTRLERLWARFNAWYFDHFLPLNLASYQTRIVNTLFAQNDNDAPVTAPYFPNDLDQFHSVNKFRGVLSAELDDLPQGTPILIGSTQALYSGPLLRKAVEKLRAKGREVHGRWAGGKVWNLWDTTYAAFDHIILAIRLVVTQQLVVHRLKLPKSWRTAKVMLVRGPPDGVFFALVPPTLPNMPGRDVFNAALMEDAAEAQRALQTAIQEAQNILSPRKPQFKMAHRQVQIALQLAVKVIVARGPQQPNPLHDSGSKNPFRQLEILHTWMADGRGGLAELDDPKTPAVRMATLGADEDPDPEYVAKDEELRQAKIQASRDFLDNRKINHETVFIIPPELQSHTLDQAFLPIDSMVGWPVGEIFQTLKNLSADFSGLDDVWVDGQPASFEFVRYGTQEHLDPSYRLHAEDRIEIHLKRETSAAASSSADAVLLDQTGGRAVPPAQMPVTPRTLENLRSHGFDLVQFLERGYAIYQVQENSRRFLFRLAVGPTQDRDAFKLGAKIRKINALTIDVFDLDRADNQFMARTDTLVADVDGQVLNLEPLHGSIILDLNLKAKDEDLLAEHDPDLLRQSLINAEMEHRERRFSGADGTVALWVNKKYRNRHVSPDSAYAGFGGLLEFLADVASVSLFQSKASVYVPAHASRRFFEKKPSRERPDLFYGVRQRDFPAVFDLGTTVINAQDVLPASSKVAYVDEARNRLREAFSRAFITLNPSRITVEAIQAAFLDSEADIRLGIHEFKRALLADAVIRGDRDSYIRWRLHETDDSNICDLIVDVLLAAGRDMSLNLIPHRVVNLLTVHLYASLSGVAIDAAAGQFDAQWIGRVLIDDNVSYARRVAGTLAHRRQADAAAIAREYAAARAA